MQKLPPTHHLEEQLARDIAEFDAATHGMFKPDPQEGAVLLAALDLGGELVFCKCGSPKAA